MLRLATDANFNNDVFRGLKKENPGLDIVRVADFGLRLAKDPDILAWTAAEGRILITHDRTTVPRFAYERVRTGLPMPGVFIIRDKPPLHLMIDEILLVALASFPDEWKDLVTFLPL
jgi:predicted nuclease of predicted toxin-antitoxin system